MDNKAFNIAKSKFDNTCPRLVPDKYNRSIHRSLSLHGKSQSTISRLWTLSKRKYLSNTRDQTKAGHIHMRVTGT